MRTKPETTRVRDRSWKHRFLYPLIALCASGGVALADTAEAAPREKTVYTVIQLGGDSFTAAINAKGQVAFTESVDGRGNRAKFYDGKHVLDIGTLGGPNATAVALNDLGQVTGSSNVNADGSITHAYLWSKATGMIDLSRPGQGNSAGNDINNKGQVVGSAAFNPNSDLFHGFFWTPRTGMLDIGSFGPDLTSVATNLNDAGEVTGYAETGAGTSFSLVVFRWTRATGIQGIGTSPSEFTAPFDINAAGHIVGENLFLPNGGSHAFLWTQKTGLLNLGSGSNGDSAAFAINDHDVVVGDTFTRFFGPTYGFVWTRETGLQEFKPQTPGASSSAFDVNNRGQVVGSIDDHAFVWTRTEGVVDLNTRIPGAPPGLTLLAATAISDNGSIVARANTGLVLLVPMCACSNRPPTVGAIQLSGSTRVGSLLSFSAAFRDVDVRDTHKAVWSWGDGSKGAGIVSEKGGAGSVSGQHAYRAPGIYTVTLTVTDSSGKSTTVQRKVTVCGSGAYLAGEGWFHSPRGASAMARHQGGIATFAVLSGVGNGTSDGQGKARVEFSAAGINFRSEQIDGQSYRGGSVQYRGRGKVNGVDGYYFALSSTVTTAGSGNGQMRMRIWHYAPGSKTEVVDYDNQPAGLASGTDRGGSPVGEGAITLQSN